MQRDVIRTITPGTTFDDNILDNKASSYLVSIYPQKDYFGLAVCDITTADFRATEIMGVTELKSELKRLRPKECILSVENSTDEKLKTIIKEVDGIQIYTFENFDSPYKTLTGHFKTKTLEGFGLEKLPFAIQAAGTLLAYLKDTQQSEMNYLRKIKIYRTNESMLLDDATIRNLELFFTSHDHSFEGSLNWVLDKTNTAMGGRMLKDWILHPLIKKEEISGRLSAVKEFKENLILSEDIKKILNEISDIERILARLGCIGGNARDLVALKKSIETVPMMKERLGNISNGLLNSACDDLIILDEMVGMINRSVNDEPPISLRDGNLIKSGYNEQLDELRSISFEGKDYIKSLQEREIKRTGISSMKIKYNRVFGYYIEVSKTNLASVPDDYIRKQTLVNAERYITPELKEYEEKVLGAEEKIVEIEYELFLEIKNKVLEFTAEIQQNARIIANIDCYLSMAIVAAANNYCEPEISENGEILVDNCRHPVIEKMSTSGAFIPNDISLNNNESLIKLITGPNMAGKSTYLRQTALVVLMAHLGSYVPADKAKICLVDRIFTRVGASDNLIKGQSTFMVEMQEAANILNNATARSLIILDEVGRGTSTYDGVSIAWAITEYIHDKIKAKTLFATHYHELISVAESLKKIKNYSVAVSEVDGGVVFLYKIVEGGVDRSYGIEVAKLAGLPTDVIRKSQQILKHLEDKVDEQGIKRRAGNYKLKFNEDQMPLFQPEIKDHPALRDIKGLDLNNMTPLQAMQKLNDLKQSVG